MVDQCDKLKRLLHGALLNHLKQVVILLDGKVCCQRLQYLSQQNCFLSFINSRTILQKNIAMLSSSQVVQINKVVGFLFQISYVLCLGDFLI